MRFYSSVSFPFKCIFYGGPSLPLGAAVFAVKNGDLYERVTI